MSSIHLLLYKSVDGSTDSNVEYHSSVTWSPYADVYETIDSYIVVLEMPGLDVGNISAEVVGNTLRIRGYRKTMHEDCRYHQIERGWGRFCRYFSFAHPIDANSIEAVLKEGILTIEIAKG